MDRVLRDDCNRIFAQALDKVLPRRAVKEALEGWQPEGRLVLISVGKAAWEMAAAAVEALPRPADTGAVISKYGHIPGPIEGLHCFEAGHPVPDENSLAAASFALELCRDLSEKDTVLFLLSGGGSALFELPLVPLEELKDITGQLLACGADIQEINTLRKRLSAVKGGKFAAHCAPAKVKALVLSDVLGDRLDMIASGPVTEDLSTREEALDILSRYELRLSDRAAACLYQDCPKGIGNVDAQLVGGISQFCQAAMDAARELGYEPVLLTQWLDCEAREAGRFLASIGRTHMGSSRSLAFLAGGETVVKLTGSGLGGRNQELALSAAIALDGLENVAVASLGSDGSDGPTDAAGGYADGDSFKAMRALAIDPLKALANNDSYHALAAVDGLLITGPTGTNVNDLSLCLIKGKC